MTEHPHTWEELVSNLSVWKRGAQVAPHKPLLTLLLLARAQRGESNQVAFEEIDQPLAGLLREFGPPTRSQRPEYPFWYLQSDGFWHVHDRGFYEQPSQSRKGKSQPTRKAFLHHHARGEVPPFMWKQLEKESGLIERTACCILDQFWPDSLHAPILEAVGLSLTESEQATRKKRDPKFRPRVLRAYERMCAVCGYDARLGDSLFGLEAAHIKWHQYSGPDTVANGLALCSLHHKAFDLGAMGLAPDYRILISRDVVGHETARRTIVDFHGRPLRPPQTTSELPAPQFITWHRKNVFRGPERE